MPGTFTIKPIEANLTHNTDILRKMSPYCAVSAGGARIKGQICKRGGKNPHWNDAITISATNQSQVLLEVMDKDTLTRDDSIGSAVINLQEARASGKMSRWYPLTYKNKAAGEILLETVYQPTTSTYGAQNQYYKGQYAGIIGQNQYYQQEQYRYSQAGLIQREEVMTTTSTAQPGAVQGQFIANDMSRNSHMWTEQRQFVEPHRFYKEVEVVETRPALQEIEVMEPVRVVKDVYFTQAVPVTKQIEVMEPQVVVKEIEVMEPRLVTKTIQVVENVTVTRQVEVVEMRNTIQEVDDVEPQTITKQVEVTEYLPVRKAVEVTQPVTLKKAVEFVEPVITTQIITKELQEPVIINKEITTTVGPASVVGISKEYGYIQTYGEISLSERQRIGGLQRWVGFEKLFIGLNDQERLFEQQRLSRLSELEWLREQERLLAMSEKDRLVHQRGIYQKYYSTYNKSGGFSSGQKRWTGFEGLLGGLNEKERLFEQERWNRFSEDEWQKEQRRLTAFNQEDRLLEQRRLYGDYLKTGGFSTYKKTTEVIEKTSTSGPSLVQNNQGLI